MARADGDRLNTPGRRNRTFLPRVKWDRDRFGQFAEGFARFMGTARFLAYMTLFIIAWLVYWKFGLALLRTAWFNLDVVWAAALLITGLVTLVT